MPEEGKRALPALQAAATYDDHHVRLTGLTGSITIPKGRLPRKTSEEQSAYQIQETGLTDSPANPIPTVNEPTLENCVEPSLQYSGLDGLSTAPQSTLTYPTNLTSEHLFIPSSSMSQQPDTSDAHMSDNYSFEGPLTTQQPVGFLGDNSTFHQPDEYSMQNDDLLQAIKPLERRDSGYAPMRPLLVVPDAPYPSNGYGAHNSLETAISFQDASYLGAPNPLSRSPSASPRQTQPPGDNPKLHRRPSGSRPLISPCTHQRSRYSPYDSAQPISSIPEHGTAPASCSLGHNGQLSHAAISSDQSLRAPIRHVPRLDDWLMSRLDYLEPELQPLVDWPPVEDITQFRQTFPWSTYIPIKPEDINFVQPFDVYVEELLKLGSIPAEHRQSAFEAAILGNPQRTTPAEQSQTVDTAHSTGIPQTFTTE